MRKANNIHPWIILATITIVVLYIFFPQVHHELFAYRVRAWDQDMFYVIGRNWAEGNLPYTTAWDSKGPIIFFFNMLGYIITKNETDVFLLCAAIYVAVVLYCYYSVSKYRKREEAFVYTLLLLAAYIIVGSGGNQVSDYTLPLSAISVFMTYKWSRNVQQGLDISHPWEYTIIYGMFFASCLFSRLTNATVLCASILTILCVLVYHKRWKNICQNILAFLLGCTTISLPIIIYFHSNNALSEMWYSTFTYNIEYTMHSHPLKHISAKSPFMYFIFEYINLVSIIIFSAAAFICKERRKVATIWLIIASMSIGMTLRTRALACYGISFLPVLMVAFIELSTLYRKNRKTVCRYAICAISLICLIGMANHIRVLYSWVFHGTDHKNLATREMQMIKHIPTNESYIIYNGIPYTYSAPNHRPYYPYWTMQDWAIRHGGSLRKKVRDCYQKGDVKWILIGSYEHSNIKDILLKRYELKEEDKENDLALFRLKQ